MSFGVDTFVLTWLYSGIVFYYVRVFLVHFGPKRMYDWYIENNMYQGKYNFLTVSTSPIKYHIMFLVDFMLAIIAPVYELYKLIKECSIKDKKSHYNKNLYDNN